MPDSDALPRQPVSIGVARIPARTTSGYRDLAGLCALSPFLGVGAWLAYPAVVEMTRPRRICIGDGRLTSRHAPLPLRGNVDLEAAHVERIVRAAHHLDDDGTTPLSYRLSAVLDGNVHPFVSGLTLDEAEYVAAVVERQLGIA